MENVVEVKLITDISKLKEYSLEFENKLFNGFGDAIRDYKNMVINSIQKDYNIDISNKTLKQNVFIVSDKYSINMCKSYSELDKYSKLHLKNYLKDNNLSTNGVKKDLINRILKLNLDK